MRYVTMATGVMELMVPDCKLDGHMIRVGLWGPVMQRDGLMGTSVQVPAWEARIMAEALLRAADDVDAVDPEGKVVVVDGATAGWRE